jgi:hypothetical protein
MSMHYTEFVRHFRDLASAFGKRTDGPEWDRLREIYWRSCRGMDESEWIYCVQRAIEDEPRFPYPARLIGTAREQRKVESPRCRACGTAAATFRAWCGGCALERPEESGIRVECAEDERDDERRRIEIVRANPRRPGEDAPAYVHRLADAMGLLRKSAEPIPF